MIEHKPVLLKESIEGLNLKPGDTVVDATLGGGGHSLAVLESIGKKGKLISIDVDERALERFKIQISIRQPADQNKSKISASPEGGQNPKVYWEPEAGNLFLAKGNFSDIKNILGGMNVLAVDGILADLGYSSAQMEDESYGLSFLKDAELDMRLGKSLRSTNSYEYTNNLSAKGIVNNYSEKELAKIIREFGEEKFAGRIAREIGERRKIGEIRGTKELAEIVRQSIPQKFQKSKIHPATKTFQALRIEVNQELENLKKFVPQAIESLAPGGRLAIISFHSLEDRIVKNIFRENARGCICPANFPQCRCGNKPKVRIITKKPITPNLEEIKENPRSRSAKLRVCERL